MRGLLGDLHGDLAPHGVTHQGHLFKSKMVQQGQDVRRLGRVAHLVRVKGGAVIAQIDADDPVLFAEGARQQAEVVQAAKEAMDQHDSRAFALILEVQSWVLLQNDTLSVVGSIAIIFNTLKEKDFIPGGGFFCGFFSKISPRDRLSVRGITHLARHYAVFSRRFMHICPPLAWAAGSAYV